MKKDIFIGLLLILLAGASFLALRFFLGGEEDTWLCVNNQWVKHGNPAAPMPTEGCGTTQNKPSVCIQVITPAKNPLTGEIKEFPTPCDVPAGWQTITPFSKETD